MNTEQQYIAVVNCIRLVAAPYDIQKSSLPTFVEVTDEIANSFSEAVFLVPQLIKTGMISLEVGNKIELLERKFSTMTKDESVWDDNSLSTKFVWQDCRNLAKQILESLEEATVPINLSHISWEQ